MSERSALFLFSAPAHGHGWRRVLREDGAHPRKSQQGSTQVACVSMYTHPVWQERRIKLFALRNFNTEFYFQTNKAPKEKEIILFA